MLIRAGWPAVAAAGGPLLDPMCGSGTLPIEAALIAGDVAPGLLRESFGFLRWPRPRRRASGSGCSPRPASAARRGCGGSRRSSAPTTTRRRCAPRSRTPRAPGSRGTHPHREARAGRRRRRRRAAAAPPGLVAANPPYGAAPRVGVGAAPALRDRSARCCASASRAGRPRSSPATPASRCASASGRSKSYTLYNGALECRLFVMDVTPERFMHASRPKAPALPAGAGARPDATAPRAARSPSRSPTACARTSRRSARGRAARGSPATGSTTPTCRSTRSRSISTAWSLQTPRAPLRQRGERCPSAADAPEARGELWASCRSTRRRRRSTRRRRARGSPTPSRRSGPSLELPPERVVLKIRRQRRGREQHEKLGEERAFHRVVEAGLRFQVNFTDYLDTGLFLDTRPVRALLRTLAAGKSFLNLFCYTGTATVCAAAGGRALHASRSICRRPISPGRGATSTLNGFGGRGARTGPRRLPRVAAPGAAALRADLPRPAGVLDLERDARDPRHPARPRAAAAGRRAACSSRAARWSSAPTCAASSSTPRRCRPSPSRTSPARTIPKDFAGNPRIHACWLLRRGEAKKQLDASGRLSLCIPPVTGAVSSAGRASVLHTEGHKFEPCTAHQLEGRMRGRS